MNLAKQMKTLSAGDEDVNAALMMLLSPGEVSRDEGYDNYNKPFPCMVGINCGADHMDGIRNYGSFVCHD